MPRYVLTLVCPDRIGIVHAVSGFLANQRCNIVDSQQFRDPATGKFFMRVHFEGEAGDFASVGTEYAMDWELSDEQARSRLLVLVSREEHCLNDLLYRWRIGALSGDIAGIVSNHPDFGPLATAYGVPITTSRCPRNPGRSRRRRCSIWSTGTTSASWCSPGTCRCSRRGCAPNYPGGSSTSTTRFCPASGVLACTSRPTTAA